MKLAAFCDTTPSRTASDNAWFSWPLSGAWGRGSAEPLALLARGERDLLPGGDHLPVLHLLNDGADLTGGCHDCKRKRRTVIQGAGGEKFLNTLPDIACS